MKSIFRGFYRPTQAEFETLWRNCIFVLDTNVLLNLYRYPEQAKNDLIEALNTISDRIWVPFYVVLEYQRNRIKVIAEQIKKFNEVDKVLRDTESKLVDGLSVLQLKKKHSSIDPEDMIANIKKILDEFREHLGKLREKQLNIHDDDKIREAIDNLLKGKIGQEPKKQDEIDSIYKEGEKRYSHKMPPGYIDIRKESDDEPIEFTSNGINYNRKYGDYLIWKQIINAIKEKKQEYVVFITDDKKDDWWWTEDVLGKKTIGPRPELMEEMYKQAGVKLFYMYNSEKFMEYSSKYLSVKYHKDSISQVRDVTSAVPLRIGKLDSLIRAHFHLDEAIQNWLKDIHPGLIIKKNIETQGLAIQPPDYSVETLLGGAIAYDTIRVYDIRFLHDYINSKVATADHLRKHYNKYYLLIIIPEGIDNDSAWNVITRITSQSKFNGVYLCKVNVPQREGEGLNLEIINKLFIA